MTLMEWLKRRAAVKEHEKSEWQKGSVCDNPSALHQYSLGATDEAIDNEISCKLQQLRRTSNELWFS